MCVCERERGTVVSLLVFLSIYVHNYSNYCEVVGHPPAPFHEGQWPK